MPCEHCGDQIKPEEPDIRYRPGDSETRYDYHSTCWLDAIVLKEDLEHILDDWRAMRNAEDDIGDENAAEIWRLAIMDIQELING